MVLSKATNGKMAARSRRPEGDVAPISTIFFDMDNTLIPTKKGDRLACNKVQQILAEKYGLSAEEAARATKVFLRNFRKCPESSDCPLDEWRSLLWSKALGEHSRIAGDVYAEWLALRYEYLAPSEEVLSLLESLRKDYFVALISNGKSTSQWEKISRLRLNSYFDCIVVSGDLPWEKPDREIFLRACSRLGVRPEECIMVGDKLETDILGAARAGLAASVWIRADDPDFLHGACDVSPPDHTISDVTEIAELLTASPRLGDFSPDDLYDCNSNGSDGS